MPLFKKAPLFKRSATISQNQDLVAFIRDGGENPFSGYTSLDKCPEIISGCEKIASTIGGMTIHIMANTKNGDERIINELSRLLDISPSPYMTRKPFIESVVMNLLLYGNGNAIVLPHTANGYLGSLEIINPSRVRFESDSERGYRVIIDGKKYDPDEVLHFRLNPDKNKSWLGTGLKFTARQVADSIKRASEMTNDYLTKQYKPSMIIKIDASDEGFASKDGRDKLLDEYFANSRAGKPWLLPMDKFEVQQVKPLTLQDLAINDQVKDLKKFAASILGIPAFALGVGDYKREEWNSFIQNTVRGIAITIQQELTAKLIISPKWYVKFNFASLYDYSLSELSAVYGGLYNQGIVSGNEVRDKLGLPPVDGLDELVRLENYIPITESGNQKKLTED